MNKPKKPKIEILNEPSDKLTPMERDIMIAGAMEGSVDMLKEARDEGWTFAFEPQVMKQLKELGLTPEQLLEEMMKEEK